MLQYVVGITTFGGFLRGEREEKSVYWRVFEQIRKYSWYRQYNIDQILPTDKYLQRNTSIVVTIPCSLFCFCTADDFLLFFFFFFHVTNQQKLFDSTKKYVCRRMNSFSTTIVYQITVFFVPVKWFCKLERIFDWRIKTLSTNTSVTFIGRRYFLSFRQFARSGG